MIMNHKMRIIQWGVNMLNYFDPDDHKLKNSKNKMKYFVIAFIVMMIGLYLIL